MYLVIIFLILNEVYVNRLRRIICAKAYPKREKYRILYLYNKLLKDRRNFIAIMKHRLNSFHHEEIEYSCFERIFGTKIKCQICKETIKKKSPYIRCSNPKCKLRFCLSCWSDIGNQCLRCTFRA